MKKYTTVKVTEETRDMAKSIAHYFFRKGTCVVPKDLDEFFALEFPGMRMNTTSGVFALGLLALRKRLDK